MAKHVDTLVYASAIVAVTMASTYFFTTKREWQDKTVPQVVSQECQKVDRSL
jgi:hypothetical protein